LWPGGGGDLFGASDVSGLYVAMKRTVLRRSVYEALISGTVFTRARLRSRELS
jgi:hypothetical protein